LHVEIIDLLLQQAPWDPATLKLITSACRPLCSKTPSRNVACGHGALLGAVELGTAKDVSGFDLDLRKSQKEIFRTVPVDSL
jgi:hypothetical protein